MSTVVGYQNGATTEAVAGATAEAAESLTVQLDSQSKLATPRREKIGHEKAIIKANEHAPYVSELYTKKHTTKSRETTPLNP
jgi:hypothetical protein